jgi:DNA polymerase (family 10)
MAKYGPLAGANSSAPAGGVIRRPAESLAVRRTGPLGFGDRDQYVAPMDPRPAAHVLSQIATLLELHGEPALRARAFQAAARTVAALTAEALAAAVAIGSAEALEGVAPEPFAVVCELLETNSALLLETLQEATPEGLLEMLRVPGLGPARIRLIHDGLHVETLAELERAASDGRLAALPRFGEKTAERVRIGIASLREAGAFVLHDHGAAEASRLREQVAAHPDVLDVAIAGSVRRQCAVVRDVDLVAAVRGSPSVVAAALAHLDGVREAIGGGGRSVSLRLGSGTRLDVACVRPEQFTLALWRATGSDAHVRLVVEHAAARGFALAGDELRDATGALCAVTTEDDLYRHLGLAFIAPELREGGDEVAAAAAGTLPVLVTEQDLGGALHCHSQYSDGGSTIAELAEAARARGWGYLGVSDHSQSNTYAGGLSRDVILRQHEEIDALNADFVARGVDFRVLKGIEADILPCGRVDYDAGVLDSFDFVIASVHTRYGMNARQMTDRVLKALEDPHITVLGHPTGRLLLTREPFAIDMGEVIACAAELGVAVELNADPHRMDIDWRLCRLAAHHGALVSLGPDAHSVAGLDHVRLGIGLARKGWLAAHDLLNTRSAAAVLAFARARREGRHPMQALAGFERSVAHVRRVG